MHYHVVNGTAYKKETLHVCLEFIDSTSNDRLFSNDILVTDKSIPFLFLIQD